MATSRCSSANCRRGRPGACSALPFEVWVNGAEQPRGLGALAKTLSMDMRANDPAWLQLKLDALATVAEERAFDMPFPPTARSGCSPAWWPPPRR
jgi:ribonucleoside-diphosphate reductase alpha chain